ncbi:putative transcription factor bHLH family [Helianthus annuus]|nr:putative transcription factor bHLH family [Helianthus annuus]
MEFSQPRPCGATGVKPTHDFLSLYSPAQQDPTRSIQGDYLKTQDFLQPLEQVGNKEGKYIEKSTPPSMVEHGGLGTYNVAYMNNIQSQKVAKAEGIAISAAQSSSSNNTNDEYSNCNSYRGTGFALWENSKGKTGKENVARSRHTTRDGMLKNGVTWMERASQSSSIHNNPSTAFSALSTSHPSSSNKHQYFADTLEFSKSVQEVEDIGEEFIIKKEPSFHHKGTISVKVGTAIPDQKSNSPRSKHSATEQRRRSKINDRFSKLRGIIPHGDQKRDKASFLLEVIEYIQFLQEKVHNYEDSSHGWTSKTVPLNNQPSGIFVDEPPHPMRQNLLDSNMINSLDATKETSQPTNEPSPCPDTGPQGQPQLSHTRSCKTDCTITSDMLKEQELVIESGTINISTIYSQGLSSAITEALTRSGLDLTHANISVQIDLGKRSNTSTLDSSPHDDPKEKGTASAHDQSECYSQLANTWEEESGKGCKRLKTNRK